MDILYYSNYCTHCQKLIQFIAKNSLADKLSCICVDKRSRDTVTGQTMITLENGTRVILPPNIQCVPALLLVNDKYRVVLGDDIIKHYQPVVTVMNDNATHNNGEPMAFQLIGGGSTRNSGIISDSYTYFNTSVDDLSATGGGQMKQMHNYIKATHDLCVINTPPDTYRPDKVTGDVTLDKLQQQRNAEIGLDGGGGSGVVPPMLQKI